jgi:branched-chain amino acid transport system permease protein
LERLEEVLVANIWKKYRVLLISLAIFLFLFVFIIQGLEAKVWVSILLSGITLAALIFLIASGLSLIFGLMDVLNFAHGAIFVVGAYVGLSMFANPRLFFNTVPFFLVIAAGMVLGQYFGVYLWRPIKSAGIRRIVMLVLALLGVWVIVFSLRRFPIQELNAFSVTAVGGAVSTAEAQEPLALMIQRVSLTLVGGCVLGLLVAPKEMTEENSRRPLWQVILLSVLFIATAYGLLVIRDPGEVYVLGLSPNIRFLLALIAGGFVGTLVGMAIEIVLIRPFYGRPVTQLVLTLGLLIVLTDLVELIWGDEGHPPMQPPTFFAENCRSESLLAWFSEKCISLDILGRAFPTYRIFIILVGVLVFAGVLIMLQRTRIGMTIRAGVQDSEMVEAMGINVRRVFTFVFALGSALAAIGGVIAAPFLGVYPAMGAVFQLQAFVAVVIGGMGSFIGAAVGTLILGLARAFGDYFVAAGIDLPFSDVVISGSPAIAKASTVLIMAIVLLVRPAGIFGKKE